MELAELESQFVDIGGSFLSSAYDMRDKLKQIKAFLFDWDGVFNSGSKLGDEGSPFSEVDSAGLRMLRYGQYRSTGEIPLLGVITGAKNPSAAGLLESHGGDVLYQKAIHKSKALEHFCKEFQLKPSQVCYVYDDVLDLDVAAQVGLRFCVGRLANPIFLGLVSGSGLADYISACQGNEHAVREICELNLALMGQYEQVTQEVMHRSGHYAEYNKEVKQRPLKKFEYRDKEILLVED